MTPASGGRAEAPRHAEPVLSIRGVSKHYGPTQALTDVSLNLWRGEVLGLIGDNGAGKSTLVNIIAGVVTPDSGSMVVDGVAERLTSPAGALERGIETVFQNLSLIPTLNITENIFLHREIYGPGRFWSALRRMDRSAMQSKVDDGYRRLGLDLPPPTTKVAALSGGQRQAVAVSRAVIWERKVVVLDEPTAALGVKQTALVLAFIDRLRDHGVGVIFISHNLEHVQQMCDRVVVLRLGRKVFDSRLADTTGRELVERMTGAIAASESL